jgi:hypothetical protein
MNDRLLAFEVDFSQSPDGSYEVRVRGANGAEARRGFLLPNDARLQELLDDLQHLKAGESALTEIGTALFAAIFQESLDNVYTSNRDALRPDQMMTLRLSIPPELEEIAALPWELMVDPAMGQLALLHAPIIRYMPLTLPEPSLETDLPLKVLLTGAQVMAPIEIERELTLVKEALGKLGDSVAVTYDPHLTVAKFREYLGQRFHIWHFVGHGRSPGDGKDAELLFEDEQGDPKPVSASQLKIYLGRSGVRLVVLNACESARLSTEMLRGIAPKLVSAQVPAVVAQQFKSSTEAARAFATGFYSALARGMPLDACVTEGRRGIMDHIGLDTPDWGIPVLYTRAASGRLFKEIAVNAAPEVAAGMVAAQPAVTAPPAAAIPPEAPALDVEAISALVQQLVGLRFQRTMIIRRMIFYKQNPPRHLLNALQAVATQIGELHNALAIAVGQSQNQAT